MTSVAGDGGEAGGSDGSVQKQWTIEEIDELLKPNLDARRSTSAEDEYYPNIFKVPESIRSIDPSAYTPQVIAIGPYHHNCIIPSTDLTVALHQYKSHCVRCLFHYCVNLGGTNALVAGCLADLAAMAPRIRACYDSAAALPGDRELAEMMLLDGSFLIKRLLSSSKSVPHHVASSIGSENPLAGYNRSFWRDLDFDLLKLENQIPFFVLTALLRRVPWHDVDHDLPRLAWKRFDYISPLPSRCFQPEGRNEQGEFPYLHLLHLFYSSRIPQLRRKERDSVQDDDGNGDDLDSKYVKLPSVMRLQCAGVEFRVKEEYNSFLDVEFKTGIFWRKRRLEIPKLEADEETNSILRNLIAFEQCYYPRSEERIMSFFAIFMDDLIDDWKDVSLLESSGILVNFKSTHAEAADLFNKLTKGIRCHAKKNYLFDLYGEVNDYRKSRWHQYRAKMVREYFSTPWSCISLFAAVVVVIAMTALQTYYAVCSYYYHHS